MCTACVPQCRASFTALERERMQIRIFYFLSGKNPRQVSIDLLAAIMEVLVMSWSLIVNPPRMAMVSIISHAGPAGAKSPERRVIPVCSHRPQLKANEHSSLVRQIWWSVFSGISQQHVYRYTYVSDAPSCMKQPRACT